MKVTDTGHGARLQRLASPALIEALGRALVASADSIAEDAAESIRANSISGPGHIPSEPGQPPNADTHDLDESIHVGELIDIGEGLQTHVIADSDHALFMEMGTSKVAARPFLMPAMVLGRRGTWEQVAAAYNRYLRNQMEQ